VTLILLDTNAVSDMARNPSGLLSQRVLDLAVDQRVTSVIVAAELEFGLAKKPEATTLARNVRGILAHLDVQSLPTGAAIHYGQFRAHLERTAQPVDSNDLLIAAHAKAINATVVTRNLKHFTPLPGVTAEDWTH
jgi:tRNA(fMet)-specific endonuclease VapC